MGTNFLIRCDFVLLVADEQRSSFMTNGHLPPVGVRLSFVRGMSVLRPWLATLAVSQYSGSSVSPTRRSASLQGTRLSVVRSLLRPLCLNSLGVLFPILSNTTCGHITSEHVLEVRTLSGSGLTPSQTEDYPIGERRTTSTIVSYHKSVN